MTPSRAAAYTVVGTLLVAWFASALGVVREPRPSRRPAAAPTDAARLDALASDVQLQASRLRERLAAAPAPHAPTRNPFVFAPREAAPVRAAVAAPILAAAPVDVTPAEPELVLIGVAETKSATGVLRTAMIAGLDNELHMVTEGQQVLGRYDVIAVGADAVELKDRVTGATRRLGLQ